jgi:hypothetical protein
VMCEWWTTVMFRAISEQNRLDRWSKPSVHNYGANGHVRKTRGGYDTISLSS